MQKIFMAGVMAVCLGAGLLAALPVAAEELSKAEQKMVAAWNAPQEAVLGDRLNAQEIDKMCDIAKGSGIVLKKILAEHARIGKRFESTYDQIRCTAAKNEDIFKFILGRIGNYHIQLWPAIAYFKEPESRRLIFTRAINNKGLTGETLLKKISNYEKDSGFMNRNSKTHLDKLKKILVKKFDGHY